jgi:hypothetical protein
MHICVVPQAPTRIGLSKRTPQTPPTPPTPHHTTPHHTTPHHTTPHHTTPHHTHTHTHTHTQTVHQQVPTQPWFLNPPVAVMLAGILPFGAIFIELFFILNAIWENQVSLIRACVPCVGCLLGSVCGLAMLDSSDVHGLAQGARAHTHSDTHTHTHTHMHTHTHTHSHTHTHTHTRTHTHTHTHTHTLRQFYYMFGFLFLVFIVLVISCSEITIVMTYMQLCAEDYHWWCVSSSTSPSHVRTCACPFELLPA